MVAISELLVSTWAKEADMGTTRDTSIEMQTQAVPTALPGKTAAPTDAPVKELPTKPPPPEKKPLLPPGFDFVRLPNGELKLVPQQGIQAQRKRETNAASKLIVNASKEARRLVRGVYKEHRHAAARRKTTLAPPLGKQADSNIPPILQGTSSTRIAALRALEALGSINLNPTARQGGDFKMGKVNGGQVLSQQPPPGSDADATKAGEPLQKKPRFKAPGATVFKAAPPLPSKAPPPPPKTPQRRDPPLPGNMLWVPCEEVTPGIKPVNRRKTSLSSVWRLYGIVPDPLAPLHIIGQQEEQAPPQAKKRKKEAAKVTPQMAAIRLALGLSANPPLPMPEEEANHPLDAGGPDSSEVIVLETTEMSRDHRADPALDASIPPPEFPEAELTAEAPPETEVEELLAEAPALSPPLEESLSLEIGTDGLDGSRGADEAQGGGGSQETGAKVRDPRLPVEGTYNFAFVADPNFPGMAVELPTGLVRKEGTLRDRAALKYPKKAQAVAPGSDVRRLMVDVSTARDHTFDIKVEEAVSLAAEDATPLNKIVAWAAQQLQTKGAVMMTSVAEHFYRFVGEEPEEEDREALPPAHLMDVIQSRLCPMVGASSFSKKHGYMLHRKIGIQHLYEAMTELRSVEKRRHRAAGVPFYVPPIVRGAINKRGPKPSGLTVKEIVDVVGTEAVEPSSEEDGVRKGHHKKRSTPTQLQWKEPADQRPEKRDGCD